MCNKIPAGFVSMKYTPTIEKEIHSVRHKRKKPQTRKNTT